MLEHSIEAITINAITADATGLGVDGRTILEWTLKR